MTNEEAKELLIRMWVQLPSSNYDEIASSYEALNMALEALGGDDGDK